jgi:hypothetical protein
MNLFATLHNTRHRERLRLRWAVDNDKDFKHLLVLFTMEARSVDMASANLSVCHSSARALA